MKKYSLSLVNNKSFRCFGSHHASVATNSSFVFILDGSIQKFNAQLLAFICTGVIVNILLHVDIILFTK